MAATASTWQREWKTQAFTIFHHVAISADHNGYDRRIEGTRKTEKSKMFGKHVDFNPKSKEVGEIVITSFSGAKA